MAILVIAEHDNRTLNAATRAVVAAAQQIGGDIHVLVVGSGATNVAQQTASLQGVSKVLHADDAGYAHALSESFATLVAGVAKDYSHVLAAATSIGKDVLPRVAALLDSQQVSEIIRVESPSRFVRPIYAGNALEMVENNDAIKVITVRATAFDKVGDGGNAPVEPLPVAALDGRVRFIGQEGTTSARPELASARVVVSGGRGLGSAENFALIEKLADKLGAAIGASRAAVDAGYVPNDHQVGQTGKVVAPELYIAVGISGAIQHLAGMKDSRVIVAINKDENAPIFEIADYGLVGDLFTLLPELTDAV